MNNMKQVLSDPVYLFDRLSAHGAMNFLTDELWAKFKWKLMRNENLNLNNPKGFNEKLQWLKLNYRPSSYTNLVDKYKVRDYVQEKIGKEYLIPLLAVWETVNDINIDSLPNDFVIKCNHTSGDGIFVCKDKSEFDLELVKKKIRKCMKKDYSCSAREWVYKNVERKILVEKLMVDNNPSNTTGSLVDYKFYCFNGEPRFLYVGVDDFSTGEKGELRLSFLDLEWKPTPFYRADHKPIQINVNKPAKFDEMLMICRKLAEGMPFVRVDLYWINDEIKFSELTFYPGGGFGFFSPDDWEEKLGDLITLPEPQNGI